MADTALQVMYRQEFVAAFEQHQSLLRDSCTTEADVQGHQAIFLVAGSGSATAVTRGANGLIPARADSEAQNTCQLAEWHDLVRKSGFNIANAQGDQRAIMQKTTMSVINRKIDSDILAALAATTTYANSAAGTASLELAVKSLAILGVGGVPLDGNVYAVISPAFLAYLMQTEEFGSSEYVKKMPMDGANPAFRDAPGWYEWMNVKWIVHPNVTGVGTSTEYCYMYHRSAIGHAVDMDGLQTPVGYNEEQAYSYARASYAMGSKLLQTAGAVRILHDGSAYAAV